MATRIPTQAEYEANELKMLFAEYRQTERQSLADKRAGASEAFAIMRDAPQVIGDRMNLIFNGDFGAGAQIHARRIISQPMRPARLMELLTLVCVLEFRCPPDATLQAWNKLDHGQQRKVNDALSAQIRVAEKTMAEEARRNPVERYKFTVPPTNDMGSHSGVCSSSGNETYQQNALWDYNSSREREGLEKLSRMPAGTRYTRV